MAQALDMAGRRAMEQDRRGLLILMAAARLMARLEQIPKPALLDHYLVRAKQERPFNARLAGDGSGGFAGRFGGGQQADRRFDREAATGGIEPAPHHAPIQY